jgi:translation elongation factor EF-G
VEKVPDTFIAPLANLFGYPSAMRGLSQGRATATMEPAATAPPPARFPSAV